LANVETAALERSERDQAIVDLKINWPERQNFAEACACPRKGEAE
jgi:hypothetical protein